MRATVGLALDVEKRRDFKVRFGVQKTESERIRKKKRKERDTQQEEAKNTNKFITHFSRWSFASDEDSEPVFVVHGGTTR